MPAIIPLAEKKHLLIKIKEVPYFFPDTTITISPFGGFSV